MESINAKNVSVVNAKEFQKPEMTFWEYINEAGETGYAAFDANEKAHNCTFSLIGQKQQMSIFSYEGETLVNEARLAGSRDSNGKFFYKGELNGANVIAFVNMVTPTKGKRAGQKTVVIDLFKAATPVATTPLGVVISSKQ